MANRIVVLLADDEYGAIKAVAGLVPLSAWFRALGLRECGVVAAGGEIKTGGLKRTYPHSEPREPIKARELVDRELQKLALSDWRSGRKPLTKPSEKK